MTRQIEAFRRGFPPTRLERPARVDDGIRRLDDAARRAAVAAFDARGNSAKLVKFVPASGAASRMFKELFDALRTPDGAAALPSKAANEFFAHIEQFAFAADLDRALGETGYAFAEIDEPELLIDHDRVEDPRQPCA